MVTLKRKFWGKNKNNKEKPKVSKKVDDPWFYCSFCSKFLKYSELINGYVCSFCEKELFIIPWSEFKKIKIF